MGTNFALGFSSDVGVKRTQNQDNLGVFPELGLFLVADGMGGHHGGETASQMAVEAIHRFFEDAQKVKSDLTPKASLQEALSEANIAIFDRAEKDPVLRGMGTTCSALLIREKKATIANVGDSRTYFVRNSGVWQATRDHSLVQEKLRAGMITRSQLKTDKMKNVITRSIGFESSVEIETFEMDIRPGDLFLICSDGLCSQVENLEISNVLKMHLFEKQRDQPLGLNPYFQSSDLQNAAQALVALANHHGGEDNVSVVLCQIQ